MKLTIDAGIVFRDNTYFCRCAAGNGREDLPAGRYEVEIARSIEHGAELPRARGIGWIGASERCDIVVGLVRGRLRLIPRSHTAKLLERAIRIAGQAGQEVTLEVLS